MASSDRDDVRGRVGKRTWLIAGGFVPLDSHGHEPELTSHEQLAVVNVTASAARIEVAIFFEDRAPITGYEVTVAPRRVAKVRFNDLIDPLPIPLERRYACLVRASVPVVVQLTGLDSSRRAAARLCATAFAAD
jgi:hypothetical protein